MCKRMTFYRLGGQSDRTFGSGRLKCTRMRYKAGASASVAILLSKFLGTNIRVGR